MLKKYNFAQNVYKGILFKLKIPYIYILLKEISKERSHFILIY